MAPILRRAMPGARGLDHPVVVGAGHFLQEDAGERLGLVVAGFVSGGTAAERGSRQGVAGEPRLGG